MTRGEIWWADYGIPFGSEPGFNRPVLIIQSDALNKSKIHTIIVVPLTTNLLLKDAPGNVFLDKTDSKLSKDSIVVVSQISVIDKQRLIKKESRISSKLLEEVEEGVKLVLEMR
jgi:mRNA interferase MazF